MIKEDNELEELIFDYLEGNLSGETRNAFELQISGDPDLQEQVDSWKMAFVEEEIPDTTSLEDTLLKHYESSWAFSLNSFLFLGLFLSLIPLNQKENSRSLVIQPKRILKMESITLHKETSALTIKGSHIFTKSSNLTPKPKTISLKNNVKKEERIVWELPHIKALREELIHIPVYNTIDLKIIGSIRRKPKTNLLSKMQIRDLNRKKRESYQKKEEMKYLKGRTPYVVPLNSKNF